MVLTSHSAAFHVVYVIFTLVWVFTAQISEGSVLVCGSLTYSAVWQRSIMGPTEDSLHSIIQTTQLNHRTHFKISPPKRKLKARVDLKQGEQSNVTQLIPLSQQIMH